MTGEPPAESDRRRGDMALERLTETGHCTCSECLAATNAPEGAAHVHANGLFCDDCPDALRLNLKRLLVLHQWVRIPDPSSDCTCGWAMPFAETHQHEAHQADVISAELARLGWGRVS